MKLQKRILNFSQITDYEGVAIRKVIEKCLHKDKIFAVAVDNASSNERNVAHLKNGIGEKKCEIMLGGKFTHIKNCAHIVSLIVNYGLKKITSQYVAFVT